MDTHVYSIDRHMHIQVQTHEHTSTDTCAYKHGCMCIHAQTNTPSPRTFSMSPTSDDLKDPLNNAVASSVVKGPDMWPVKTSSASSQSITLGQMLADGRFGAKKV